MTALSVGQRVRCVHGDSVLIGTVVHVWRTGEGCSLRLDGGPVATVNQVGWDVEVLPEPEPPDGTVVVDCDGDAWQLVGSGWRMVNDTSSLYHSLDALEEGCGPLTLLEVAR